MTNKLKKMRQKAGLTQAELAKAAGVTQPHYQRWEAGKSEPPADKLAKIASALGVAATALKAGTSPVFATLYDETSLPESSYYGEAAFHFAGQGKPLLISISEAEHRNLFAELQHNSTFIVVQSLSNQLIAVRRAALADVYLSSEAYDDFGPEHGTYEEPCALQLTDSVDWDIIEAIANDVLDFNDDLFDEERVAAVQKLLERKSAKEIADIVADGYIAEDDVEETRAAEQREIDRVFELATSVKYQFSNGIVRVIGSLDAGDLYMGFGDVFGDFDPEDDTILVREEGGYHRAFSINPLVLDYVSVPLNQWERGRSEAFGEVDESDD
jgi:transcriptional regulator with XRE-family HTH domain